MEIYLTFVVLFIKSISPKLPLLPRDVKFLWPPPIYKNYDFASNMFFQLLSTINNHKNVIKADVLA